MNDSTNTAESVAPGAGAPPAPRNPKGVIIPAHLLAEMKEAAERAARGERDPERMRRTAERMDRIRAENLRLYGVEDVAVGAVRSARDGE